MIAVDNVRLTYSQEFMPCQRRFRDSRLSRIASPSPPSPESASASSWIRCGDELLIWRIPSFHLLFCFFFYYNFHESRSNYADIINKEIRSDLGRSGLDRTTLIIDDSGRVIAVVLNAHLVNNPRDLRRLKRIFACNIDRTRGTRISVRRVSIDIGRN